MWESRGCSISLTVKIIPHINSTSYPLINDFEEIGMAWSLGLKLTLCSIFLAHSHTAPPQADEVGFSQLACESTWDLLETDEQRGRPYSGCYQPKAGLVILCRYILASVTGSSVRAHKKSHPTVMLSKARYLEIAPDFGEKEKNTFLLLICMTRKYFSNRTRDNKWKWLVTYTLSKSVI